MPDFGYNGITHNSYFITINYGFITGSYPNYPAASPLAVQTPRAPSRHWFSSRGSVREKILLLSQL